MSETNSFYQIKKEANKMAQLSPSLITKNPDIIKARFVIFCLLKHYLPGDYIKKYGEVISGIATHPAGEKYECRQGQFKIAYRELEEKIEVKIKYLDRKRKLSWEKLLQNLDAGQISRMGNWEIFFTAKTISFSIPRTEPKNKPKSEE